MADELSRAVARVVVAQIAEGTGFDACQESAVDILADLLLKYISTICVSSHSFAEQAGRSQANLADVLLSLEELGVTADDLYSHVQLQQGTDVPFAHTLAPFPVHSQRPLAPTFREQKEEHAAHIPDFLPAFPDPHTYQQTAAYAGHEADPYKQRQSMLEAKQKAEAALNKMHQRMSSKVAQPDSNPFMAPPTVEQVQAGAAPGANALQDHAVAALQQNGANSNKGSATAARSNAAVASAAAPSSDAQQQTRLPEPQQPTTQQHQVDLDEDALFEQAVVLQAFSSILPAELLATETKGPAADEQQQQQLDVVEEQPMDIDGGAAASIPLGSQTWLGWKPQRQEEAATLTATAAAVDGLAAADAVVQEVDPTGSAAGKRAALVLLGKQRPADAYAEKAKGVGVGSSRQRKSKYDADPRMMQAEGILAAGPEQVFSTVGGGLHAVFDSAEDTVLE